MIPKAPKHNRIEKKTNIIRDRAWLDELKTMRCIFTGVHGNDYDGIDPMHIGTEGKGIKSSDDEALPALHSIHQKAHQIGEVSVIRQIAPDWLIRDAFKAYARELYRQQQGGE